MSDEERTPAHTPPAGPAGDAPADSGASREEKMAAIRARVEALRAARGGAAPAAAAPKAPEAPAAAPPASAAPAAPRVAPAAPRAAAQIEVPVTSLNPGGRPGTPPAAPALQALGTLNQGVEIRGDPGEGENLKKILGGLGAYQNPLRGEAWQIDYRYYPEAKRRLAAAGYTIAEQDYLGRPLAAWNPAARGWTRVEPA